MKVSTIGGIVRGKTASGKRGRTAEVYDASLYTIGEGQAVDLTDDIATIIGVEVSLLEGFENDDETNPVDTLAGMMDEGQVKKVAALVAKTRTRIAETLDHKNDDGKRTTTGTSSLVAYSVEVEESDDDGNKVEVEDGEELFVTRFGIVLV